MNFIIDIQSLSKIFKGKKGGTAVTALRDLTLQIRPGMLFGFVGPNGAGKSTAIKILMGFLRASQGTATLCSIPVTSEQCRKRVGYLPENPIFHDFLTAREVLETTAILRGIGGNCMQNGISQLLHQVNLSDDAKRPVRGFSKGMTQRLGIANALVGNPDLLILDEPMSGLDPLGRDLIRGIMLELRNQGKTIFFSSHILHDVETICDEVAILLRGELQFRGKLEKITNKRSNEVTVQFKPATRKTAIGVLENLVSFRRLNADICEIIISRETLPETVQNLLNLRCEIITIQQQQSSLENFFLQMVQENRKIT